MLLDQALRYKAWADRRTLDAVAALNPAIHAEPLAFARQQLNHMVRVEELFRARLLAQPDPHPSTNSAEVPTLPELDARLSASNTWLVPHWLGLTPAARQETIRFVFADGLRGSLSREEIIYHLINHGSYHRGAIGHALDRAGAYRPPDTYTIFVHADQPGRRSDLV